MKMSRLSPKMWYLLKYGFLALIAVGVFLTALPRLAYMGYEAYQKDELDLYGENFSDPYLHEEYTHGLLREDIAFCLGPPAGEWTSEDAARKTSNTLNGDPSSQTKTVNNAKHPSCFGAQVKFNDLLSAINVKAAILEPSILHCMLQTTHQALLAKRSFNLTSLAGLPNIVTYGILQADVPTLQQKENIHEFNNSGFKPFFANTPVLDWMPKSYTDVGLETFPSHVFYIRENCSFHLVVFYERRNYLWHASLSEEEKRGIPLKAELMFAGHNGAFEKFAFVSIKSKLRYLASLYIPSSPHYFLFQMQSSKFLECDKKRAANMTGDTGHPMAHGLLSVERFDLRTLMVIHQLKTVFQPLMLNLWIWSGTMLGWYRQCGIIPYTSDVDFAAWAGELEDLDNLIGLIRQNNYITIKMRMGMLSEALEFQIDCKQLRTDIFFMYRVENGSWCSGHSPKLGYYFRYYYPHFTLCSADLLGEKVQVPCETEDVILSEYGPDWSKPVSTWNYERSIRNRGPDIHWSKAVVKDAYQVFKT